MGKYCDVVGSALFYGVTWVVAMLPRWLFYGLSDVCAVLLCFVVRYRRGTVRRNLERSFPEKSARERWAITWRFYRHLSDLFLESAFLMHASPRRMYRRFEVENLDAFTPYYREGRSVVVAASHYGNWEFLTLVDPLIEHKMLSIYKALHNKRIERIITRSRQRMGSVAVESRRTLRALLEYQRRGIPVLVGLITDQTPANPYHYWCTFLNQDTVVYRGIEQIAKKFDMPVFFCNMQKPRRGCYRVRVELITDRPRETPEDWITAQHVAALERCIRREPAYWLWSHRRWKKKRPVELQEG